MYNKLSISNILVIISIITTLFSLNIESLNEFGISTLFLNNWDYIHYILQYIMYSFVHWSYMHLLWNILFIYLFWNIVEIIIGKNKFMIFFLFITIFNWILLSYFSEWTTIWISWFAVAILIYYTLELKSIKNPEYKWWITAILLLIWIWFIPWISLLWHLFWSIWWAIFYYLNKNYFSKQEIWFIEKFKNIIPENKIIRPENIKKELEN